MIRIEEECKKILEQEVSDEYEILNNVKIIDYMGNISENIEILIYNKNNNGCLYGNLIYLEAVSMVIKCDKNTENFKDELIKWSESIRDLKHKLENIIDEDKKICKPIPIIAIYGRNNLHGIDKYFHMLFNKNGEIIYSELFSNLNQMFYKLNYDGKTSKRSKEIIENLTVYKKIMSNKEKIKDRNKISDILEMKIIDPCLNDKREGLIKNKKIERKIQDIETKYIVGFHIDKIQNFLFSSINSHNNDSEKEELRQKMILNSSNEVSNNFFKIIEEKFKDIKDTMVLVKTSGKYIFGTNLEPDILEKNCKEIFEYFYQSSNGLIFLLYFWDENKKEIDNKTKINMWLDGLKSTKTYNNVLEKNAKALFELSKCTNGKKKSSSIKEWRGFVREIDELNENISENDSIRSRIGIIKADFDGMGNLFKSLECYEEYDVISKLLNDYINIDKFDEYIHQRKKNIKVFPFYMAGDDIFIACRVKDIFNVVEILKNFLKDLNREITINLSKDIQLTMCVGIEITENKQPIRFFYERVEKQLEIAKRKKADNKFLIIGFYNRCFMYNEWNTLIEQISFIQSLKNRNRDKIKETEIVSTTYLYNLYNRLVNLSEKKTVTFCNLFFYEIFPKYIEDRNREKYMLDTSLKSFIFLNSYKNGVLNNKFIENLKLIILFLDNRYKVELNLNDYYKINKKYYFYSEIKKNFLKKIMESVYSNHFSGKEKLRDQFLRKIGQENYKLLNKVGISTLFRIKREILSDRKDETKIKKMLMSISEKKEDFDNKKSNKVQKFKSSMYFSFENFFNINDKDLDNDFIDSVIIFYKYRMAYKKINEKIKKRGEKNGK
jgi:hypothetical protein